MDKRERIEKCLIWFKELKIGTAVDIIGLGSSVVTDKTSNSIELFHHANSNKGIDYTQWYDLDRLSKLTNDYS